MAGQGWKTGEDLLRRLTPRDVLRFLSKVGGNGDPEACWPWLDSLDDRGRGKFWAQGEWWWAPRLMWLLKHGPLPAARDLHHKCRNRSCVNPRHAELVIPSEHAAESSNHRWRDDDGAGDPF